MDIGVIILCPERNVGGLKNTVGSIRQHSYDRSSLCVVGDDASDHEVEEMRSYCPTHRVGDTITGLVNFGVRKTEHEWAFVVFCGSRIQSHLERRLQSFATSPKVVLFPVVDRKFGFVDGSFNGVLINTGFFKEVGDFPVDQSDFELAKLLWASEAIAKGGVFKAIVGMRTI